MGWPKQVCKEGMARFVPAQLREEKHGHVVTPASPSPGVYQVVNVG